MSAEYKKHMVSPSSSDGHIHRKERERMNMAIVCSTLKKITLISLGALVCSASYADSTECKKIKVPAKRLACFDSESKENKIQENKILADQKEAELAAKKQREIDEAEEKNRKNAETERIAEIEKSRQKMEGAYRAGFRTL